MNVVFEIFGSVFYVAQKWQNISDKTIVPMMGMTVKQWMLIVVLEKFFPDYPPTINQAAEAYGASRQNIKRMASDMQKNKLVILAPDPDDKRIQRLVLTGKHRPHFEGEENARLHSQFIMEFFKGVSKTEMERFNATLKKLTTQIEAIENKSKQ